MEEYSDEIFISLASFLCPHDMLSTALSCKRFGARHGAVSSRAARQLAREANKQEVGVRTWSLMEEAARQAIETSAANDETRDAERCALPRRGDESWMSIYHELQLLRAERKFDQVLGAPASCSPDRRLVLRHRQTDERRNCTAMSQHVMRAGKHAVVFDYHEGEAGRVSLGIMRPVTRGLDRLDTEDWVDGVDPLITADLSHLSRERNRAGQTQPDEYIIDCCMLDTRSGSCYVRDWSGALMDREWDERTMGPNFPERSGRRERVILALDLDAGQLIAHRDGQGEVQVIETGLKGEFCWCATLRSSDCAVKIDHGRAIIW